MSSLSHLSHFLSFVSLEMKRVRDDTHRKERRGQKLHENTGSLGQNSEQSLKRKRPGRRGDKVKETRGGSRGRVSMRSRAQRGAVPGVSVGGQGPSFAK